MTAVFDIGRTNKKFFVFDDQFREVHRVYATFPMVTDEDGFPCEDLTALVSWMRQTLRATVADPRFRITALNFSAYGASLVHVDESGAPLTPLYNYEKPYPAGLAEELYAKYNGATDFALATGSDAAGMLNSGLQLYWLKRTRPKIFARIAYSLHLPQYLSYVFTGRPVSEFTSIGCHTALWDYRQRNYHEWVHKEGVARVLAPVVPASTTYPVRCLDQTLRVGVGLHDSSAALLPYLQCEPRRFCLLSTGTWSVSLNPFAGGPLRNDDQVGDCINYMTVGGEPVRAARLFLGEEYRRQTEWLAERFGVPVGEVHRVSFDQHFFDQANGDDRPELSLFTDAETVRAANHIPKAWTLARAYHFVMDALSEHQYRSLADALDHRWPAALYLDGGFGDNEVFCAALCRRLAGTEFYLTDASMGSALGAAVCLHDGPLAHDFLRRNYGMRLYGANND